MSPGLCGGRLGQHRGLCSAGGRTQAFPAKQAPCQPACISAHPEAILLPQPHSAGIAGCGTTGLCLHSLLPCPSPRPHPPRVLTLPASSSLGVGLSLCSSVPPPPNPSGCSFLPRPGSLASICSFPFLGSSPIPWLPTHLSGATLKIKCPHAPGTSWLSSSVSPHLSIF